MELQLEQNPNFLRVDLENSQVGYFLEVDVKYPCELHNEHEDLPFLPEHRDGKLTTTLYEKRNNVAHYTILAQALDHGLSLRKIHRALQFQQKPWLRPYIEMNTRMRAQSENNLKEMFFKLMNNAIYRKYM